MARAEPIDLDTPAVLPDPAREMPGLLDAVAQWCECLQGRQPLLTSLGQLAQGLGAQAICLSRISRGADTVARTLIYNAPLRDPVGQKVTRSFAASVLGRYVDRPRAASVWSSSLADEQADPALAVFQKRARIVETVVIALSVDGRSVDYLEIHFGHRLGGGEAGMLNMVAATLSRTWQHRRPGLLSEAILKAQSAQVLTAREPLLSTANPARLSRAEFRVCLLLSRGLSSSGICDELSISRATLKTHLRNIFAKSETSSLAELLFQLLAPRDHLGSHDEMMPRRA